MAELVIQFLGGFTVTRQETQLTRFYSDKVRALLAFLVVESQQPHSRSKLAGLLWPENDESRARQSLRQALAQLRKLLDDKQNPTPFLITNQQTIQWNREADWSLDVDAFSDAIERGSAAADAADLYAGDFLDGFFIADSPAVEEWILLCRERLRHDAIAALDMAVAQAEYESNFIEAQRLALRWRGLDPLQEECYQSHMRCAMARGDLALALSTFEQCAEILSAELGVAPSVETIALRDKARLSMAGRPDTGSPSGHETRPNRHPPLPAPATPFIGREQELREIDKQLFDPGCRLLNLIGLGGIGKTRLALAVAQNQIVADAFADGVYWVSLAGADALLPALITSLGLDMPTTETLKAHVIQFLGDREILLVLDNLEDLIDEAPLIAELLSSVPRIKMLCTSRVRIGIQAEWLWDIRGLSLSKSSHDFETSEAVQLFVQSAQRAQNSFTAEPADQEHIARICQMVDGHPLSISLAAAWVRLLSCREIRVEISSGLDLLASEEHDVAERHRSAQVIFEHTWQTLTATEQTGLRDLSVFSGPFSRQAASQVADVSAFTLIQLVNRSLLQRNDEFFTLHPVIRHYAADKLAQSQDDEIRIRAAHSNYHLRFLVEQLGEPRGSEQPRAQRYVSNLLDDIHKGWHWALDRQSMATLADALHALYTFYETSSWYKIGVEKLSRAVTHVEEWTSSDVSVDGHGDAEHSIEDRGLLRGRLLAREAVLRYRLGELTSAFESLQEAIDAVSATFTTVPLKTQQREVAFVKRWLGTVLHELGRYDDAERYFTESLALYEASQDQQGIAHVLCEMADLLYFVKGKPEEALPIYRASLQAARRAKDRWAEIIATSNHGCIRISLGEYAYAEELLLESLHMSRELGAKRLTGVVLNNLAIVAYEEDPDKARKLTEENYAIRVEIGDKLGQANCLRHMAQSSGDLGDYSKMLEQAETASRIYTEIENQRGIISGLCLRVFAHAYLGDIDKAQSLLKRTLSECRALESNSAWFAAIFSGLHVAVVQGEVEYAFLLAGQIMRNGAAHNYDRESAEKALRLLRAKESAAVALIDEAALLERGGRGSHEQAQRWMEEMIQGDRNDEPTAQWINVMSK